MLGCAGKTSANGTVKGGALCWCKSTFNLSHHSRRDLNDEFAASLKITFSNSNASSSAHLTWYFSGLAIECCFPQCYPPQNCRCLTCVDSGDSNPPSRNTRTASTKTQVERYRIPSSPCIMFLDMRRRLSHHIIPMFRILSGHHRRC